MPSIRRSPAPKPHRNRLQRASQTNSFRDRAHSDLLWKQGFAQFLTFKLAHCPTPVTQTATFWLSYPFHWAIQLWATRTYYILYNLTELLKCELPLGDSTLWLRYSMVSYLVITLQLNWAIQLWFTAWLLYLLTELLWATSWLLCSWLSYPIVRNYGSFELNFLWQYIGALNRWQEWQAWRQAQSKCTIRDRMGSGQERISSWRACTGTVAFGVAEFLSLAATIWSTCQIYPNLYMMIEKATIKSFNFSPHKERVPRGRVLDDLHKCR